MKSNEKEIVESEKNWKWQKTCVNWIGINLTYCSPVSVNQQSNNIIFKLYAPKMN